MTDRNLPMSFARGCLVFAACAVLGFALSGCAVETITTRTTSAKGHVVETTRTTKKADPAAWTLAGAVVDAYSPPRLHRVREEKADPDLRRLLRGWQGRQGTALTGPITAEEIANRWKP